jgi:hypothetical protein
MNMKSATSWGGTESSNFCNGGADQLPGEGRDLTIKQSNPQIKWIHHGNIVDVYLMLDEMVPCMGGKTPAAFITSRASVKDICWKEYLYIEIK